MLDLRVTTIRRILTIVSVQFPPNSLTTMLVLGEHLNHTNEVQVNDRRADFVVISPSKMLVTIPTALCSSPPCRRDRPALRRVGIGSWPRAIRSTCGA